MFFCFLSLCVYLAPLPSASKDFAYFVVLFPFGSIRFSLFLNLRFLLRCFFFVISIIWWEKNCNNMIGFVPWFLVFKSLMISSALPLLLMFEINLQFLSVFIFLICFRFFGLESLIRKNSEERWWLLHWSVFLNHRDRQPLPISDLQSQIIFFNI